MRRARLRTCLPSMSCILYSCSVFNISFSSVCFCAFPLDILIVFFPDLLPPRDSSLRRSHSEWHVRGGCSRASSNRAWADAVRCSQLLARCHRNLLSDRNGLVDTFLRFMLESDHFTRCVATHFAERNRLVLLLMNCIALSSEGKPRIPEKV